MSILKLLSIFLYCIT